MIQYLICTRQILNNALNSGWVIPSHSILCQYYSMTLWLRSPIHNDTVRHQTNIQNRSTLPELMQSRNLTSVFHWFWPREFTKSRLFSLATDYRTLCSLWKWRFYSKTIEFRCSVIWRIIGSRPLTCWEREWPCGCSHSRFSSVSTTFSSKKKRKTNFRSLVPLYTISHTYYSTRISISYLLIYSVFFKYISYNTIDSLFASLNIPHWIVICFLQMISSSYFFPDQH